MREKMREKMRGFGRRSWMLSLLTLLLVARQVGAAGPEVLFDQAHGQRFVIEEDGPLQLSALAETLTAAGANVRSAVMPLTDGSLEGMRSVVLSGPFLPLGEEEISALLSFVDGGGRLAVMLHIGPPMIPLLHSLGVDVANGVVHERTGRIGGRSLDFMVSDLAPHLLTEGVDRFTVFGTWALQGFGNTVRTVARTGAAAWVDLDGDGGRGAADAEQSFAVVVAGRFGQGEFVVFGDDAIFQNRFLRSYNRALAGNLARWLAGG